LQARTSNALRDVFQFYFALDQQQHGDGNIVFAASAICLPLRQVRPTVNFLLCQFQS
jgi:hypothetical protein